jgi:hypothetical protein
MMVVVMVVVVVVALVVVAVVVVLVVVVVVQVVLALSVRAEYMYSAVSLASCCDVVPVLRDFHKVVK